MSAEDLWEEEEVDQDWIPHGGVDGTAPPELDAVLGRHVGRTERNIIRAAHAERNAGAKSLVRTVAARLGVACGALDRVLALVDRARNCSQRERAVAALYAARVAPTGALVDALLEVGAMDERDEFYPFRIAYECGLSPGPMDAEAAANIYSVHRLPRTARELASFGLLEAADRFVRAAIVASDVRSGRSHRARAVAALREVDRQMRGVVDWEEVNARWRAPRAR
ncbi:hypothetical protein [Conexivisphaera calida]|uniref:Uncharacterized protein n=1 Tax=Conexivisphaera calida TaxID=1874277 RepID=A0A4P2VBX3_9ARCH|nr:hypothetical protein [Conexivisphaera calida]BBE42039.1 hypothetical protein NAS2_0650 [Conexivisphaera calida]